MAFQAAGGRSDTFLIEGGADGAFNLPKGDMAAAALRFVPLGGGGAPMTANTRFVIEAQSRVLCYDPDGTGPMGCSSLPSSIRWSCFRRSPPPTSTSSERPAGSPPLPARRRGGR